jgi:glycosyltransferase involved in cell wall biosynthesis
MPLPDESWPRGKCGLKARQYMALGIPTICSPLGVNTEMIQDGVNEFIAATEEEWITKLKRMLEDANLRASLGASGKATVEERYSVPITAPKVAKIFLEVAAG